MRDSNRCAALNQDIEGFLDLPLGLCIDGRGGFVENQDSRIGEQSSGYGYPLTLAPGERLASLANERIIAIGQFQNKVVGFGGPGRSDDLISCGVGATISDVLSDRSEEQKGFLENDPNVATVLADRIPSYIDTIDDD